jgi:hypothetical protein
VHDRRVQHVVAVPVAGADSWAEQEWSAFGDSIFAGDRWVRGAPAHLEVEDRARGGTTLVPIAVLGQTQLDIATQIAREIELSGKPRRVVISAGMADLYARQVAGVRLSLETYVVRYQELHDWLTSLGIDVHWMTLPPATPQAIVADQEWMRVAINDWLRSSGLPIVDCESVLGGVPMFLSRGHAAAGRSSGWSMVR